MKKSKLILIISAVACVVLAGVVMIVAFNQPKHQHTLGEAKTYHITNDDVYYTKQCKKGCAVRFETDATFEEVLTAVSAEDSIVLDEDIELNHEIAIKSFVVGNEGPKDVALNINLNLNNHKILTDVNDVTYNSLFMLNANYGIINFTISNGSIYSEDLLYLFRFMNNGSVEDSIQLTLNNVECKVVGSQATPLFAHTESSKIKVNANGSRFIAEKAEGIENDYGVGVFINSESEFNFNNCYFEGGDAVYVKRGMVNLTGCELVNSGLTHRPEQVSDTFFAIGSCLATETYTTATGSTEFDIIITNCKMVGNQTSIMMYVAQTAKDELIPCVNAESSINVVSCTFNNNPVSTVPEYGIIHYPNNIIPVNNGSLWVVG